MRRPPRPRPSRAARRSARSPLRRSRGRAAGEPGRSRPPSRTPGPGPTAVSRDARDGGPAARRRARRHAASHRPDRDRQGQRGQRRRRSVGAGIQHAVDEDRPADDRGRQRVAGQQAHPVRGGEARVGEQARVDQRRAPAAARASTKPAGQRQPSAAAQPITTGSVQPRSPGQRERPDARRPAPALTSSAPTRSMPARRARRLDAAGHDVDQQQRDDPGRHVQEEDPLPAGAGPGPGSAARS